MGQLFETEEARVVPVQREKKKSRHSLAEGHSSFGTQIPIKCPREIYRLRSSYIRSATEREREREFAFQLNLNEYTRILNFI